MNHKSFLQISFVLIFVFTFKSNLFSQPLSLDRIQKIKDGTVRVSVVDGNSIGTGFTINNAGLVVTCWHVLQSVLISDAQGHIIGFRDIIVEYNNGDKYKYGVPLVLLQKSTDLLIQHDICIIAPNERLKNESQFLKTGSFSSLDEGQEVVTCGYPLGITKQFISKGMVSTKSLDTASFRGSNGVIRYSCESRVKYVDNFMR